MCRIRMTFPARIRIGVPPDALGHRLDHIKAWLDQNCGANGWALKKSGVGAVSIRRREAVVPAEGLGQGDIRTKPISIIGTERQQTVHSQVSRVLALWEIVRKTFRLGGFASMSASSVFMIAEAEQCVIRIGVPGGWLGSGSTGSGMARRELRRNGLGDDAFGLRL